MQTRIRISTDLMEQIHAHGEACYPEEGAGLMLGEMHNDESIVRHLISVENARESQARHNRYLLSPEDYLKGELKASQLGLDVIGVFHSHPDHPNQPSEFDRQWALPNLSYLITSVHRGKALESKAWRLSENRATFIEQHLQIETMDSSRMETRHG